MKKILKIICFVIISVIFLITGILVYQGYSEYKEVIAEKPVLELIEEIKGMHPTYTKYSDISPNFIEAIIAVEDRRFRTHKGFDSIGIIRAGVTNLLENRIAQGGSTITQQLAKNIYFSSDQTFVRKIAEVFMALKIESLLTKDEILELYSNVIYLGKGYYGVDQASHGYFNKSPSDLTVAEAAYIAGLPQAPSRYSEDKELGTMRQQEVMDALRTRGYIE
ncbi:hypothetical protein AN639_05545 [Candidatus Epulonipiscium fishelsonii]|uniref:Uncharacterized protein n=1 Tax=Candidatus Epulonipiscium fishelsonii TaxID=77094 RepID=A0ACC8X970_9FIRM|nr:hypothetical protein AN396_10580 [Epulopiscium sp. SCG-B11WGA-EpuloA1]ONI39913.1 hypothetical protein AN639_05545 [Epulopiscium sp. SCG-B05WGA-EpuloA1]